MISLVQVPCEVQVVAERYCKKRETTQVGFHAITHSTT